MNKCFCSNLHQADLALTAFYNHYISPTGLTIRQYTLLSYLQVLQPINVTELALAMNLDRTTLVRNLKPLMAQNIIADDGGKGRSRRLVLTAAGAATYQTADRAWKKAQADFTQRLGTERSQQLMEILGQMEQVLPEREA